MVAACNTNYAMYINKYNFETASARIRSVAGNQLIFFQFWAFSLISFLFLFLKFKNKISTLQLLARILRWMKWKCSNRYKLFFLSVTMTNTKHIMFSLLQGLLQGKPSQNIAGDRISTLNIILPWKKCESNLKIIFLKFVFHISPHTQGLWMLLQHLGSSLAKNSTSELWTLISLS